MIFILKIKIGGTITTVSKEFNLLWYGINLKSVNDDFGKLDIKLI